MITPLTQTGEYLDFWGAVYGRLAQRMRSLGLRPDCYRYRVYAAPELQNRLVPVGGYQRATMAVTPGSFILGLLSGWNGPPNLAQQFVFQVTDVALNHKWFSDPVPAKFFNKPKLPGSGRLSQLPWLFEAEYPVPAGSGLFLVEFWNSYVTPADQFFGAGFAPYQLPQLIFKGTTSTAGMIGMVPINVGGSAQQNAVFKRRGAIWRMMQGQGTNHTISAFKTLDNGFNWSIADPTNGPVRGDSNPSAGCWYDGADTVLTACIHNTNAAGGAIFLRRFDIASETWGVDFDTAGAPSVHAVYQAFQNAGGDIVVFHDGGTRTSGINTGISLSTDVAGVWTSLTVDDNVPAGYKAVSCAVAYDPAAKILHVFIYAQQIAAPNATTTIYQRVDWTGAPALGAFHQFTTEFFNAPSAMANPIIVGDQIILPVVDANYTFPCLLIGTPLSAPTFTVSETIDPLNTPVAPLTSSRTAQPTLAFDGSAIWAVYTQHPFGLPASVRLLRTFNLTNPGEDWAGGLLYSDTLMVFGKPAQYPSIAIINGQAYLTINGEAVPLPATVTDFDLFPRVPAAQYAQMFFLVAEPRCNVNG